MKLSDIAADIVNDLHTERLEYISEYLPLIDAINKLGAYESIGFEPEEIIDLIRYTGGCRCGECENFDPTGYAEVDQDTPELQIGHCKFWRRDTQACRFCSEGEQKEATS